MALADYDRAIQLNPGYGGAYRNRAFVYLAQGESELALADLERAINSSQESPPHTLAGASHTRLWGI